MTAAEDESPAAHVAEADNRKPLDKEVSIYRYG